MNIDWNRLQLYKTTKTKSFEQLFYQIAERLLTTVTAGVTMEVMVVQVILFKSKKYL